MQELIAELKERLAVLGEKIDERNEWHGDDFNPCDASGGNFDDAYYMGVEDGETDGEYHTISKILAKLEALS